ncbi:MAG: 16S rRNA (guanine(966)-N(2))-methyltransferase RsmD [Chloroflexi bacterium]|nr:16S rRNA (guanine(966)-N(2))-methyltransferase RsmD [Chloroflexota bacterium]
MRVISGIAKGRKLKAVPSEATRPITDRTKEALFNILGTWIIEARVLDLFSGTGAVGIEALSRGAAQVTFIEKSQAATRIIGENLRTTGLAARALVKRTDVFDFLDQPSSQPFDLIYIAPPQYKQLWLKTLQKIDRQLDHWLLPDGAVVVQIHPVEYEDLALQNLVLYDERKYGSTLLCFYERVGAVTTYHMLEN